MLIYNVVRESACIKYEIVVNKSNSFCRKDPDAWMQWLAIWIFLWHEKRLFAVNNGSPTIFVMLFIKF